MTGSTPERATFRDVFAIREFRALWLAQILSVAGDQLARVALTVLVFNRTQSALLTATTYAVSYLPPILGGFALAGLADRFPRRPVMVVSDVARAALVAIMAVPFVPLWTMIVLLFTVTLLESPFKAARAATFPDILSGDKYVLGMAVTQTTFQIGLVAGFATGGLMVGFLGARPALAADAATFIVSAALVQWGVRARPAAGGKAPATGQRSSQLGQAVAGARLVFRDRTLATTMLFGWLAAFYAVPESLAVPYAANLGGGPIAAGLVFASMPLGTALGAIAFGRLVDPPQRLRWIGPLAVCCCGVLVLCALQPGLGASLLIFALAGAFGAYQLAANAAFVAALPDQQRAQAFGLANAGMLASQGIFFVLAGAAAEFVDPAIVIAVSGALGAAVAGALATSWHRAPAVSTR